MKPFLKNFFSVIALMATLFSSFASFAATNEPVFPDYDPIMNRQPVVHHSCACTGVLGGSASALCKDACNCSCISGLFACSCTCSGCGNDENMSHVHPPKVIYVTPDQYKNWKEMGEILLSDGSTIGREAYNQIVTMFEMLKKEDYKGYEAKIPSTMVLLKSQTTDIKGKLNAVFVKNHSDIRI